LERKCIPEVIVSTKFTGSVRLIVALLLVGSLAVVASADTLKLKNGSVIKGKVISFVQGEFTVLLDLGGSSKRSTSRMIIAAEDVESIEFDGSDATPSAAGSDRESTREVTRETATPPTRSSAPKTEAPAPPPTTEESATSESSGKASSLPVIVEKEVRVAAAADWSSSEVRVTKGQKVVIEATGEVDLGNGQKSAPGGIAKTDPRKLMANRPTGSLIAVIGDDNDNFIFVGRQIEFTAANSGILFLSINEGDLKDNGGSFIAHVKVMGNK
jgi:hypothetical protein